MTTVATSAAQEDGDPKLKDGVLVTDILAVNTISPIASRTDMALALLLEQLVRLIYPERSPQDMHPGQWAALRYINRANLEACTVVGLSRYLGITQGPASRAITALERKGLIAGTRGTIDRRVIRLTVTGTGKLLLQHDPIERLASLVGELDEAQRSVMATVVDQLFSGLSKRANAFTLHEPDINPQ